MAKADRRKIYSHCEVLRFCELHIPIYDDCVAIYDEEEEGNELEELEPIGWLEVKEYSINGKTYFIQTYFSCDSRESNRREVFIIEKLDVIFKAVCLQSGKLVLYDVRKFDCFDDVDKHYSMKKLFGNLSNNLVIKEDTKKKTKI